MEIKVICNSAKRKGFIMAASSYFAQILKIKKHDFQVHIYTIPKLSKKYKRAGSVHRMHETKIHLLLDSRLGMEQLVQILAHEFVHVKQHVLGELTPYTRKDGKYGWKWMGKINRAKYENMPWEIEARTREKVLGNKLIDILNAG